VLPLPLFNSIRTKNITPNPVTFPPVTHGLLNPGAGSVPILFALIEIKQVERVFISIKQNKIRNGLVLVCLFLM